MHSKLFRKIFTKRGLIVTISWPHHTDTQHSDQEKGMFCQEMHPLFGLLHCKIFLSFPNLFYFLLNSFEERRYNYKIIAVSTLSVPGLGWISLTPSRVYSDFIGTLESPKYLELAIKLFRQLQLFVWVCGVRTEGWVASDRDSDHLGWSIISRGGHMVTKSQYHQLSVVGPPGLHLQTGAGGH